MLDSNQALSLAGHRWLRIIAMALSALALGALATPQLIYPFGHDQGIYSACGDVIRRGGVPIRDCFESKGPGVMVLYAVALSIAFSTVAVHAFTLIWQAITAALVGWTARAMFHPAAALPAAAFYWLIYAGINYWSMNQAETFSNLFIVLALYLAWRGVGDKGQPALDPRLLVISGASAGILMWFKYTFGLFIAAIGAGLLLHAWLRTRSLQQVIRGGIAFAAGTVAINALVLIYFALAGGIPALVEQFNVFRELFPLGPPRTLPEIVQFLWRFTDNGADLTGDYKATVPQWTFFGGGFPLLFILALLGGVRFIHPANGDGLARYAYLVGLFIAGLAVVAIQAKYVQYHFTILHAPLAIMAGAGVAAAWLWLREPGVVRRALGALSGLAGVAAFALLALRMLPWVYDAYVNVVVQGKSLREIHLESRVAPQLYVADYIVEHTRPDETISLFADAPWVYMLTQRRNATRFPFADVWAPAHGSWTNATFGRQFYEQVVANRPTYFILTKDDYPWLGVRHIDNWKRLTDLHAYVEANYRYEGENGPFLLFRRKD
ncbi:MAG: glycosyltransferase family 39 protein [Anaerolineae bacterium]|nr:glycosyltransferase family 39 protein [Candidatus Roseilinea sp.]MDW8449124.1 glycosyltransferase family 39 protein [Anaerolineae bacterium]